MRCVLGLRGFGLDPDLEADRQSLFGVAAGLREPELGDDPAGRELVSLLREVGCADVVVGGLGAVGEVDEVDDAAGHERDGDGVFATVQHAKGGLGLRGRVSEKVYSSSASGSRSGWRAKPDCRVAVVFLDVFHVPVVAVSLEDVAHLGRPVSHAELPRPCRVPGVSRSSPVVRHADFVEALERVIDSGSRRFARVRFDPRTRQSQ